MQPFSNPYADRQEAGRQLAQSLLQYKHDANAAVLGLSSGGILVGAAVAETLEIPLDIFSVRAVGIPGYERIGMGYVARGVYLPDRPAIERAGLSLQTFWSAAAQELENLAQHEAFSRDGRPALALAGRTVIAVDDGLTDGAAMAAAVEALHRLGAGAVIVAVPLATADAKMRAGEHATSIVCLHSIDAAASLESWYGEETEVGEDSVRSLLRQAAGRVEAERGQEVP